VTDSELTIAILRKIHDRLEVLHEDNKGIHGELKELKLEVGELKGEAVITNRRLSTVDGALTDLATQMLLLGRYVKNSHERALVDLRKRVARLEKKVG
jgi:hypothetical protein